jgi:endonuclease/exonuclease/phosphatase family protein
VQSTTFRVSSFNVLGAAHTEPGGTRPEYANGQTRMRWAMSVLRSANVSVAGLQEFEQPQHAAFQQAAPGWDVFPGLKRSRSSLANSIVWRSDVWQFVSGYTIDIPYFGGKPKPMPYILLRHVGTGREVWFANFHNPASVHGPAAQFRREAVSRESALANRLASNGTPVIMTGDMNDRAEFFCPMTARSQMHAANGGSRGAPCNPPANMRIDWILGSAGVDFSGYEVRDGALVDRTSDHPFVVASATVAR